MPSRTRSRKTRRPVTRTLDARPDTLDFRDKMFEPTLVEVMLDRLDDALEPLARTIGGKSQWTEMKENATLASAAGLRVVIDHIAKLKARFPALELHLVGHSAGSILLGGLLAAMTKKGSKTRVPVTSCTLWAPACTIDVYRQQYLPAIDSGQLQRFALFTLTDKAERDDDCGNIYHKSLLYLVSNAFETRWRKPLFGQTDGEPLLGMEKFVRGLPDGERPVDWVLSPNTAVVGDRAAARATAHGAFDDDGATLRATLARILDTAKSMAQFEHHHSASANQARRAALM
jgi:hypothetical protein